MLWSAGNRHLFSLGPLLCSTLWTPHCGYSLLVLVLNSFPKAIQTTTTAATAQNKQKKNTPSMSGLLPFPPEREILNHCLLLHSSSFHIHNQIEQSVPDEVSPAYVPSWPSSFLIPTGNTFPPLTSLEQTHHHQRHAMLVSLGPPSLGWSTEVFPVIPKCQWPVSWPKIHCYSINSCSEQLNLILFFSCHSCSTRTCKLSLSTAIFHLPPVGRAPAAFSQC